MSNRYMPLVDLAAIELRGITSVGLVLPTDNYQEAMLVLDWDDQKYAVLLEGNHAFKFFPIQASHANHGLFFSKPDIRVDIHSRARGTDHQYSEGALILMEGGLHIIAGRAGDQFGAPQPLPLWTSTSASSGNVKLAFTRWSVGYDINGSFVPLWESVKAEKIPD